MIVELYKDFTFDAAHYLPMMPEGHKCKREHGHTYQVRLVVKGEVNPQTGIFIDYAEINHAAKKVCELLDHYKLNDVPGLENPTTENLCRWVWDYLKPFLLQSLTRLEIKESASSGCIYHGEKL